MTEKPNLWNGTSVTWTHTMPADSYRNHVHWVRSAPHSTPRWIRNLWRRQHNLHCRACRKHMAVLRGKP